MTEHASDPRARTERRSGSALGRLVALSLLGPMAAAALAGCGGPDAEAAAPALTSILIAHSGATNPTLALGPTGDDTYVAWVAVQDGVSNVFFTRSAAAGPEPRPVQVNHEEWRSGGVEEWRRGGGVGRVMSSRPLLSRPPLLPSSPPPVLQNFGSFAALRMTNEGSG